MPEASRGRHAGEPDNPSDQQRRNHMAYARLIRGARRLPFRPAALARDQRDWYPMVRDYCVQDAHDGDGADQQQLGTSGHRSSP